MAIYTVIGYQACCDDCGEEFGIFPSVEMAQQAVKNDKEWEVIEGKAYCPQCSLNHIQHKKMSKRFMIVSKNI